MFYAVLRISVLTICFVLNYNVTAVPSRLTDAHKTKLSKHFTSQGINCLSDNSISFDDVKLLSAFKMPQGAQAPCFFACVLKRAELMDDDGKIPPEAVLQVVSSVFDNENDRSEAIKVFQACAYVNDAPVSDGTKGCDRAMLALKCLMKQSLEEETTEQKSNSLPNGEDDANHNNEVPSNKRNIAKVIMTSLANDVLRITCTGFSTVRSTFPFNIFSNMFPTDTFSELCYLLTSFSNK